jgi:hypothetical protein
MEETLASSRDDQIRKLRLPHPCPSDLARYTLTPTARLLTSLAQPRSDSSHAEDVLHERSGSLQPVVE